MRYSKTDWKLIEQLEEVEAMREAAANLERLRGVIHTRFRTHPNATELAMECHRAAQSYMAEFDRKLVALLNSAFLESDEGGDNHA